MKVSFEQLRFLVTVTAAAIGVYGAIAAILARSFTNISEEHALLFIGFPVALVAAGLMWERLPNVLGFKNHVL